MLDHGFSGSGGKSVAQPAKLCGLPPASGVLGELVPRGIEVACHVPVGWKASSALTPVFRVARPELFLQLETYKAVPFHVALRPQAHPVYLASSARSSCSAAIQS